MLMPAIRSPETSCEFVLSLHCNDAPGIVAALTAHIAGLGGNIVESGQFWDRPSNKFFMRVAFTAPSHRARDAIERALAPVVARFGIACRLVDAARMPRIAVLVSKSDHCLQHLAYQIRVRWLHAEIAAIISNHPDSRDLAERQGIPYHHLPVDRGNRAAQERRILEIVEETGSELVVLARYMQILSDDFAQDLVGRVINIHHSFLPSFKGAKPYHQAHARGVKLIGATAHYVTAELDEGPIIEQETERVTHALSPEDYVAVGRDIEARVLARAVKLHLEQRIIVNGAGTVVF